MGVYFILTKFIVEVINKMLTPLELNKKIRTDELIQSCGDSVYINDIISGTKNSFDEIYTEGNPSELNFLT